MKGRHDRNVEIQGRVGRHQAERRCEWAMDVEEVDPLLAENAPHGPLQAKAHRDPGEGAVAEEHGTPPDAVNPWGIRGQPPHPRGDHDRGVSPGAQVDGQILHMLGHTAEVRVVILRHQGDAERATPLQSRSDRCLAEDHRMYPPVEISGVPYVADREIGQAARRRAV